VADNYGIAKIYESAAEDVKVTLGAMKDVGVLQAVIRAHYETLVNVDGPMGRVITSVALKIDHTFVDSPEFERMMLSFHVFGSDVALALRRRSSKVFRVRIYICVASA
jgi:hypothetical protein